MWLQGGEVAASVKLTVTRHPAAYATLGEVATHPSFRRRGIAHVLCQRAQGTVSAGTPVLKALVVAEANVAAEVAAAGVEVVSPDPELAARPFSVSEMATNLIDPEITAPKCRKSQLVKLIFRTECSWRVDASMTLPLKICADWISTYPCWAVLCGSQTAC